MSKTTQAADFDKRLGMAMREQRVLRGLSQADVGDAIDVSPQMVQKMESGINRISAYSLTIIAKRLGVSSAFLLEKADQPDLAVSAPQPSRTAFETAKMLGTLSAREIRAVHALVRALAAEGEAA
jgi:transcriptional regulator with XRE-family HTH domain